jgi:SH3 domain-containing YSC84-like protein 1
MHRDRYQRATNWNCACFQAEGEARQLAAQGLERPGAAGFFDHREAMAGRAIGKNEVQMMKKILFLVAMMSLAAMSWADETKQTVDDRLHQAGEVLRQVMATPDKGIPQEVLDHAKCIAVVPHLIKGGFIFGAEGGRGVATCRTAHGWSAPAFFDVEGGSWGLQIGAEGIDLVMIIQNDRGMQQLLGSKFQIGADASAAAGPVGRHASADTDWKMNAEILTYSRAKGAFAGLTLNGAAVHQDKDAMAAFYGPDVTVREALQGHVPAPPASMAFLDAVRSAREQSHMAASR